MEASTESSFKIHLFAARNQKHNQTNLYRTVYTELIYTELIYTEIFLEQIDEKNRCGTGLSYASSLWSMLVVSFQDNFFGSYCFLKIISSFWEGQGMDASKEAPKYPLYGIISKCF